MSIFEKLESEVRYYCRNYNEVFTKAKGSLMYAESGKEYIDFFAGAGALNYGHNNDYIKSQIVRYIESDGISHGLDMFTEAKKQFLETFSHKILQPRGLNYKVQFCGPTGANAVEAAMKLARKVKKRNTIFSFMGAFHGVSLGGLSATSSRSKRAAAGIPLHNVTFLPYPHGFMNSFDTIKYLEEILQDDHSGIDKPAAIIFETIQAEGGIVVPPDGWFARLAEVCRKHDILTICDDIQVGCGRSGTFFSFETLGFVPDLVVLSKSISGYGLPMSLVLIKPEHDVWKPAEHNGTFRGNQLAFVGARAALEFRELFEIDAKVEEKAQTIQTWIESQILPLHPELTYRGRGLIWGIDFSGVGIKNATHEIIQESFRKHLIVESAGRADSVLKLLPALTIEPELLERGLEILRTSIEACLERHGARTKVLEPQIL